ncbi:glycosyltransferase family 4 protein [Enterovibrio calviensis]|uniref:glycosyltransferase family 4 protein n=1 Tax=Enterovibrio calviensis TaxID=91359 RepID=UPI003735B976
MLPLATVRLLLNVFRMSMRFPMVSVRPQPLHICHVVSSLSDAMQNDQVFSNIRHFPQPYFEHTLIVLKKSKILSPQTLPHHASFLELDLKGSLPRRLRECHKVLVALKPHVCQTYGDKTFPIQWVARRQNVPVKLHMYQNSAGESKGLNAWFRQWMHRTLSYSSDFVIAQSDTDKAWLNQVANIPKDKLQLIRCGVDSRKYCPSLKVIDTNVTNHFVGTVPVPTHRFVIGVDVSGQRKSKLEAFFDEYFAACMRSPTFKQQTLLLVSGNSPHLNRLRRGFEGKNVAEEQIRFCGHLKDNYLFHTHIDAFVCLRPEQHDTSVLEAMSMGLPIASHRTDSEYADVDHPLYWSTDSETNMLQDQLLELFSDNNKRLKIGRAARRFVQDFHCQPTYHSRFKMLYDLANSTLKAEGSTSSPRPNPRPTQSHP